MTSRRKTPRAATSTPTGELVELLGIARKFVSVAKALRRDGPDAALGELVRLAPDDPASYSAQAIVFAETILGALDAWSAEAEGLEQRRNTGLQRSLEARQDRADADARAINAEATRLLAAQLAARYVVGTIARTMKRSPSTVRRALAGHPSGLWPGPKTKRARA